AADFRRLILSFHAMIQLNCASSDPLCHSAKDLTASAQGGVPLYGRGVRIAHRDGIANGQPLSRSARAYQWQRESQGSAPLLCARTGESFKPSPCRTENAVDPASDRHKNHRQTTCHGRASKPNRHRGQEAGANPGTLEGTAASAPMASIFRCSALL